MPQKKFFNEAFFNSFRENPEQAFRDFGIEFGKEDKAFFEKAKQFNNFNEFQSFFMKSRFSNFFEF